MLLHFWLWSIFVFDYFQKIQSDASGSFANLAVAESSRYFGNKLYSLIAKDKENVIFSPHSLHTVLSLLYAGTDGRSKMDMQRVLGLPEQTVTNSAYRGIVNFEAQQGDKLSLADKVYFKKSVKFRRGFLSTAVANYKSDLENIDFTNPNARKTINAWVESKTNHKIRDLIQSSDLNNDTRLVLINTLYFSGLWSSRFGQFTASKFYVSESNAIDCVMMRSSQLVIYHETDTLQVIRLPYRDHRLRLVIVLPKCRTGIAEIEGQVTTNVLFLEESYGGSEYVDVTIPKFKIESTINFEEILAKLGLDSIFDEIDLSKMVEPEEPLAVGKVLQKVYMGVNENGTEAASATEVFVMEVKSLEYPPPGRPKYFNADHPFLFFLEGEINGLRYSLFQGKISKPEYN